MKKLLGLGLVLVSSAIISYAAPKETTIINNTSETTLSAITLHNQVCLDEGKIKEVQAPVFDIGHPGGDLSVEDNSTNIKAVAFPNPTVSKVTISLDQANENAQINVFDVLGVNYSQNAQVVNNAVEIDASTLSSGTYYVKININGKVYSSSFIVNK